MLLDQVLRGHRELAASSVCQDRSPCAVRAEGPGVGSRLVHTVLSDPPPPTHRHRQLDWVLLFWLWASLDGRPSYPLCPCSPSKAIPTLATAGHRECFWPSLSLLFPGRSHSLSLNPLPCISSSTSLSPPCSLLKLSSNLLSCSLHHFLPSLLLTLLSISLSPAGYFSPSPLSAALWLRGQGRVPVPGGCNPPLPEGLAATTAQTSVLGTGPGLGKAVPASLEEMELAVAMPMP